MPDFFFTFGFNSPGRGRFVRIRASDMASAREEMFRVHGERWAFCYTEAEWRRPSGLTQQQEYGLSELDFINLEG